MKIRTATHWPTPEKKTVKVYLAHAGSEGVEPCPVLMYMDKEEADRLLDVRDRISDLLAFEELASVEVPDSILEVLDLDSLSEAIGQDALDELFENDEAEVEEELVSSVGQERVSWRVVRLDRNGVDWEFRLKHASWNCFLNGPVWSRIIEASGQKDRCARCGAKTRSEPNFTSVVDVCTASFCDGGKE